VGESHLAAQAHLRILPHDPNKALNDSGYTDLETLMGFYLARQGSFDDFLLNLSDITQRLEDSVYSGQALGVGDAATTKFQLTRSFGGFSEAVQNPAGQSAIVYVNGIAKVQGTDYTIANGIVTFAVAPARPRTSPPISPCSTACASTIRIRAETAARPATA
jgi:uncharacterized protein (TIGR02217 family)